MNPVERAVIRAAQRDTGLTGSGFPERVLGLTTPFIRHFINALCKQYDSYTEVGTLLGATAIAAKYGNRCAVRAIDNFSYCEFVDDIPDMQGVDLCLVRADCTPHEAWYAHVEKAGVDVELCKQDYDPSERLACDVFYYDGDHSYDATLAALRAQIGRSRVILVDDFNAPEVRRAVEDSDLMFHQHYTFPEWNGFLAVHIR